MKVVITAILICVVQFAQAQSSIITRFDGFRGSSPSYGFGVVRPEIEVWALALPDYPDVEIGKLFPVKCRGNDTLLVGGYAVSWPNARQYFALPWGYYQNTSNGTTLSIQLGSYVPLNGGPTVFFSDESSLVHSVGNGVSLGLATAFWHQRGASNPMHFGPVLKAQLNRSISLSARALVFGSKAPDNFRLELTTTF